MRLRESSGPVLSTGSGTVLGSFCPVASSCTSLVRVCMPLPSNHSYLSLQFIPTFGSSWVHLAEVTFYNSGATCTPSSDTNMCDTTHPNPEGKPCNCSRQVLTVFLFDTGQVVPLQFIFPRDSSSSGNGSTLTGRCTQFGTSFSLDFQCTRPTSNVLFDGNIPALVGLDGDTWASELQTIETSRITSLNFDFGAAPSGVTRVEIVMFNCPEWGIGVQTVRLRESSGPVLSTGSGIVLGSFCPVASSCTSLVRVCMPLPSNHSYLSLQFIPTFGSSWVHLAEVTFYNSGATCTPSSDTNRCDATHPNPEGKPHFIVVVIY